VGTEKRERQKANRAKKQAEMAKAERTSAVKRNIVRWVLVIVAGFVAVLLIAWIGGAFDDDDEPTITVPSSLPVDLTIPDSATADSSPDTTSPASTLPATDAPTTTGG
jgi:hypothetical protein